VVVERKAFIQRRTTLAKRAGGGGRKAFIQRRTTLAKRAGGGGVT
jgi:hypothetical protein